MKDFLSPSILQYITRILIVELGLAIIVGVILLLREHSLNAFGDWMFWAGLIILALGALSMIGGWGITRGGVYQIGQTVGEQSVSNRTKADLKEEQASFSFLLVSTGVGILAIVISVLF
jgi:hypothetical protein